MVKNSNFDSTCWPGHPSTSFPINTSLPLSTLSFLISSHWSKPQNSADYTFPFPLPPQKMAVDLLRYRNLNDHVLVQEAAPAGFRSMQQLIRSASDHQNQPSNPSRTGHARFRRAMVHPQPQKPALTPVQYSEPRDSGSHQLQTLDLFSDFSTTAAAAKAAPSPSLYLSKEMIGDDVLSLSASVSTSANSSATYASTITGEGSVSNGKSCPPQAPAISAGKPPLSGKRCREHDNVTGKISDSSRCHCKKRYAYFINLFQNSVQFCEKNWISNLNANIWLKIDLSFPRKNRIKRTIRAPAVSSKVSDIPADEYSWRKYGQKPIKGSPYPR